MIDAARRRPLLAALLACASLLNAGSVAAQQTDRKTLTIGIAQFPGTFNPLIDPTVSKNYILGFAQRQLTSFDADWKLICQGCVDVPTLENGLAKEIKGADGARQIQLTFKLKPNIFWGDGKPVTAADYKLAWDYARSPLAGVGEQDLFKNQILDIQTPDDHTLLLTRRYSCDYNVMNDLSPLPAHLEEGLIRDSLPTYINRTLYETERTNPGLYNGPYRVSEFQRGQYVVLARNDYWKGTQPAFDRIVVKAIENTAALEANLLSGGIDMIAGELGLELDQALDLEKRQAGKYQFQARPLLAFEYITPNLDNQILKDLRVRQALLHAIDRKQISDRLFAGKQPVAHSYVSPEDVFFVQLERTYPFDAARAAALLTEAGWTPGPGGIRRNAAGEPLRLEITTTAGNRTRERLLQVIQRQWKAVGADLAIKTEPARQLFGDTVSRRKFPALTLFAQTYKPKNVPVTLLHSSGIPSAANGWAGQNYGGYNNPAMDQVIGRMQTQCGAPQENKAWADFQALFSEELPTLPLFFHVKVAIIPFWLKGLRLTGHQYASSEFVETWTVQP